MAYYLQFDGGVQHVDITPINIGSVGDYVEVDAEFHADAGYQVLGAVSGNNILEWSSATQINVRFEENTFNNNVNVTRPSLGQRFKLRFERGSAVWEVYIDDSLEATLDRPTLTFNPSIIGGVIDGSFCSAIRIYNVNVFKGGVVAWNYDPSLSGGTGNLLPDSVAGDDGVLDNFPIDDSQWIFYSEGGGTSLTGSLLLGDLTVSSSMDVSSELTADITLGELVLESTVSIEEGQPLTADITFGDMIVSSDSEVLVGLEASITLDSLSVEADSNVTVESYVDVTLGELSVESSVSVLSDIDSSITLSPLTLVATASSGTPPSISGSFTQVINTNDGDLRMYFNGTDYYLL